MPRSPFIALNNSGSVDIAYLPNIIPSSIQNQVVQTFIENQKSTSTIAQTTITGSWSRYKSYIHPCSNNKSTTSRLIDEMTGYCNNLVHSIISEMSNDTINQLDKVDKELQRYAKYPTAALNILNPDNYNEKTLPYKPHTDTNDIGISVFLYFGSFQGGELILNDSKMGFKIFAGDIVVLNTRKYTHQVAKVRKGERIGLVYFLGKSHVPIILCKKTTTKPRTFTNTNFTTTKIMKRKNYIKTRYSVPALKYCVKKST